MYFLVSLIYCAHVWLPEVGYNPAVGWSKESPISKIYTTLQWEHT